MATLVATSDRFRASRRRTADRYGHLFPSTDDGTELVAAEKALVLRSV